MPALTVFPDHERFVTGAAQFIAGLAAEAIGARGRFDVALSGGATPRPIYERLAAPDFVERVDWARVHVFFGDERCVPPDDPRSNYRMAREALLDHAPLPAGNVHRIRGEDDPSQAALAYEQEMHAHFRTLAFPRFDLICLGLGDDGHTASLFPGATALREHTRPVVAQYVGALAAWRVTLTVPTINAARNVAFLVEGSGKAETLRRVLLGSFQPDVLPAQRIQPSPGRLHWLVDTAAAMQVEPE